MRSHKRLSWGNMLAIGGLAVILLSPFVLISPQQVRAVDDERTITLYEIHLKETTTVTYKRDGKFIPEAMKKLNWALRDWRRNQPTRMNPKLIDLVWTVHKRVGSKAPIHVISGYRSPKTNAMLRRRGGGQARRSQHMLGRAMDVHFPDVPMRRVRNAALVLQHGGVGYYPTSAISFVHMDVARVRSWPRLPRSELAMLFPYVRALHRPSRGGPLTRRDQKRARVRLAQLARKRRANTLLAQAGQAPSRRNDQIKGQATVVAALDSTPFQPMDIPGVNRYKKNLWFYKMGGSSDLRAAMKAAAQQAKMQQAANRQASVAPMPERIPQSSKLRLASLAAPLTKPLARSASYLRSHAARLWVNTVGARRTTPPSAQTASGEPPTQTLQARQPKAAPKTLGAQDNSRFENMGSENIGARKRETIVPMRRMKPGNRQAAPAPANNSAPRLTRTTIVAHSEDAVGFSALDYKPAAPKNVLGYATQRVAYAPAFDEEDPDELNYHPFKIMPLMSARPIVNNTRLVVMQAPAYDHVVELLSLAEDLPMQFHTSPTASQARWLKQFQGEGSAIKSGQPETTGRSRARL